MSVFAVWLAWAMPTHAQAPVEPEDSSGVEVSADEAPADGDTSGASGASGAPGSDAPGSDAPGSDALGSDAPGDSSAARDPGRDDGPSAESSPPSRPRVGVMVLAVSPEDAALAEGLGEVLLAAIAGRDALRLVGKEEIQAALGHDDAASLGCLAAPACLGQLGVQLGLGELVAVTLGRREGGFAFDLGRFDPRTGERLAHVFREVDADEVGALADAMLAALSASEEVPPAAAARVVLTVAPHHATVRIDGRVVATSDAIELSPGAHRLVVHADGFVSVERTLELSPGERRDVDVALASNALPPPPATESPRDERRAPWTVIAIASGGLAVGAGALGLGLGVRSQRAVDEGVTRAEALAQVEARRRDARIANVGWVVGSAALATAAVTAVLAWRGRREGVALVPIEGGALASIEVRR